MTVATVGQVAALPLVRCGGDLDLCAVDDLSRALAEATSTNPPAVLVDLRDVPFLDCRALRVLLAAAARCGRAEAGFVLVGLRPVPLQLLGVLQLAEQLPQAATVAAALDMVGTPESSPGTDTRGSGQPRRAPPTHV